MGRDFLSDIELFYSEEFKNEDVFLKGEEYRHIVKVLRHKRGDRIFVTEGKGKIFETEIVELHNDFLRGEIISEQIFREAFPNIVFVLPRLRKPQRFEFALEKSVELGITNFVVYDAARSVAKGDKSDRWRKIALSAMKQSLGAFLPKIEYSKSLENIDFGEGNIVITLSQQAETSFSDFIAENNFISGKKYFFVFGPEGDFSPQEKEFLENSFKLRLTNNRLRTETAVTSVAAFLSLLKLKG